MPNLDAALLQRLLGLGRGAGAGCECLAPLGPSGPEPLCALYHASALPRLRAALDGNILKMRIVLNLLATRLVPVPDARPFENINTPEDWRRHD
jgi:molybdopterin-guanine dinucleotide biosynthesis protein A